MLPSSRSKFQNKLLGFGFFIVKQRKCYFLMDKIQRFLKEMNN